MSTLAEIEEAVDTLPRVEQETLLRRLTNKLKTGKRPNPGGWPVPPPDVPKEELERIHAMIEAEFPTLPAKG